MAFNLIPLAYIHPVYYRLINLKTNSKLLLLHEILAKSSHLSEVRRARFKLATANG